MFFQHFFTFKKSSHMIHCHSRMEGMNMHYGEDATLNFYRAKSSQNWSIFRHALGQPCDDELESIIFLHSYFLFSFWLGDSKWNRCDAIWNRFYHFININWISVIHKLQLWVYFPWGTLLGALTIGYTKRMSHWKIALNFNWVKT
jgi:hypothetical protein